MTHATASSLQVALLAAREAGEVLRRRLPRKRQVEYKGPRDIVTDADFAAQAAILARLKSAFPEHLILSEEGRHDLDLFGPVP
ncbi:MAG: inositol monophosphatase, partial [Anaerolineales bacterium]|nr:inositol monophosphatase [Anaerolineales bacterium]